MITYHFQGQRRECVNTAGSVEMTPGEVPAFVQRRFALGWRWLTVTESGHPTNPDRRVGRIEIIDGRRTWWAET